uniref:PH domain-containing protein n=2 Tax=Lygus hesperus TaxID=30085 RepID=A0A0K8SGR3_LYGHE
MEGSLSKWTNLMKGWQYRWFVLDDCAGVLSYYLSRDQMIRGERRGCINLKRAVIGIENEDDTTFTITSMMKTYHFQAQDSQERDGWVGSLEDTILRHSYGSRRRKTIDFKNVMDPQPTIESFDKKLAEADAYLQLVIDQTKQISSKMDSLQKFEDQARCSIIATYANNMLDYAKNSIVLLQIAKHTMDPENMTPLKLNTADQSKQESEPNASTQTPSSEMPLSEIEHPFKLVHSTSDEDFFDAIEVGSLVNKTYANTNSSAEDDGISSETVSTSNENEVTKCPENDMEVIEVLADDYSQINTPALESDSLQTKNSPHTDLHTLEEDSELNVQVPSVFSLPKPDSLTDCDDVVINCVENTVPEATSDPSASEEDEIDSDEDEIYEVDCTEETDQLDEPFIRHAQTTECNEQKSASFIAESAQTFQRKDGSLNYDYFYECEEESDVKIECSVVTHLLSQVKIGMDLSKVVLPTFILEKRSLLEMYADFFAHPDLFLGITDQPDAKERMVQLVKWYITSFHAGRKTSIPRRNRTTQY